MSSTLKNKDLISIKDLSKEDLLDLINTAQILKNEPRTSLLKGKILASCFFEPSTRTRLSFESAMHRLGGVVIGFSDSNSTSTKKGESLRDTIKMMGYYADIVVIRHPLEGSAQLAADAIDIPVINAGDGANQHPTQTLQDLFTIHESQQQLENLHIAMVGDLKYGRTVHSLAQALIPFHSRLYFVSPPTLEMPKSLCDELRAKGIKFSFHTTIEEIINKLDILYMTRIQEERISQESDYKALKGSFIIKPSLFENAKNNLKVLHPLPRVDEIDARVDETPFAFYFQQAGNGIYARQALLASILGMLD